MRTKYLDAFSEHKYRAKISGIPFHFTFETWLAFWKASGKLDQRGRGSNKYCMARFGDKGPYKIGNVRIATNYENNSEAHLGRKFTKKHRERIAASLKGRKFSAATRAKMAAAKVGSVGNHAGMKHSAASKAKMSASHRARLAKQRRA